MSKIHSVVIVFDPKSLRLSSLIREQNFLSFIHPNLVYSLLILLQWDL